MTAQNPMKSIQRYFLGSYTTYNLILITLGVILVGRMLFSNAEEDFTQLTNQWANVIADKSVAFIINNDAESLHQDLLVFNVVPNISHVHIYRLAEDNTIEFFTSYNQVSSDDVSKTYAIEDKADRIESFLTPVFNNDYIEYSYPIKTSNTIIGYIYLRTSLVSVYQRTQQTILIIACIAALVLIGSSLILTRLQRHIISPIQRLIDNIQYIAQHKDYSARCSTMPLKELDILSQKINIMLARTEKHLARQSDAEKQIIELNHKLEDKVNQRTEALKESNQELLSTLEKLHQYQGQLVESEKMASLGDMVAGVAHEVNTPIGLGVTASSLLSDKLEEIKAAFEDKTLKSSNLKKFLEDGQENIDIVCRNLKRAADLISSFKKLAVDQSSDEKREFNVKKLIEEVLLTLAPQLRDTPYKLNIVCPEDLVVISKPGPINQILVNLIINSIIHGFEDRTYGTISIEVQPLSKQLYLHFSDDGRGVDESIKAKIFDPFITTKRGAGGSGLGLNLVYNLVTQALAGEIHFDSKVDKGVSFDIRFPVQ